MTDRMRLITDTDNGLLLIISGPSGVGKTTITRGVERSFADSVFSVSCTTRPRTEADVEGVDYQFVTRERFEEMERDGDFLESAEVFGNKYGTPAPWVNEQLSRGRLVILEIDVQGAIQVKRRMPGAMGLFILPPSEDELLDRLRKRKREAEEVIQRRFAEAKHEMALARESGVYDHFIVNRDLPEAMAEAVEVVRARRGS